MKVSTIRFLLYLALSLLFMPAYPGNTGLMLALFYYIFMLSLTFLFMRRDSIRLKFWFPTMLSGVVKGLIFFPILLGLNVLVSILFPVDETAVGQMQKEISKWLLFLVAVLAAPIVEEMMFRGYIQEYFRRRLRTEVTIVVSALIFSFYHPFNIFPHVFVTGVFLSFLRELTGSLVPGIVVHAANNIVTFITLIMNQGR